MKATRYGTTKRAQWRRENPSALVRLRPEAIYKIVDAEYGGDRAEARRLLKRYGYLRDDAPEAAAQPDRVTADRSPLQALPRPVEDLRAEIEVARKAADRLGLADKWVRPHLLSPEDARLVDWSGLQQPGEVIINPRSRVAGVTALHEFGHELDSTTLPAAARGRILRRLRESDTVRAIQEQTPQDVRQGWTRTYLLRDDELVARAFAQWVVERAGNRLLRRQLRRSTATQPLRQWRPGEINDVFDEFDRVFGVSSKP